MNLSEKANSLKIGQYEHYKGNRYQLLGIGRHSETLEEFAIYQSVSEGKELWIRPLNMFCQKVKIEKDIEIPRFSYIEES